MPGGSISVVFRKRDLVVRNYVLAMRPRNRKISGLYLKCSRKPNGRRQAEL